MLEITASFQYRRCTWIIGFGYPRYSDFKYSSFYGNVGYLADKISSSLTFHYIFHWFREVLVSELLTNGIAVYAVTNQSCEAGKKMLKAKQRKRTINH